MIPVENEWTHHRHIGQAYEESIFLEISVNQEDNDSDVDHISDE